MFFLNVLVSYITSCEMPPYTLYFVSIELFIFVFLIYESYTLNTLCPFLEKKVRGLWLSYFLYGTPTIAWR